MRNILPDSIRSAPHVAAFDDLAAKRLGDLPLDSVLTYLIDTVSSSALPYLAEQFDVMGYKGYRLAQTDADRREIIKKAIELKRHMGTVWAIKQALLAVGFGAEAELVEGVGAGPTGWAVFRILIDLGDNQGISGTQEDELTALINQYKNARSHLESIAYKSVISDALVLPDDTLNVTVDSGIESDTLEYQTAFYDGTWSLDGSINYDEMKNDVFAIQII